MPLELYCAGLLALAMLAYAVLAGADFGAGIWELHTALDPEPRQRRLLHKAIGPVWEANHVWLIFALVILWTAFPPAFAELCRFLAVPLLLALLGIVFRGAAYALRGPAESRGGSAPWGALFAVASSAAPFFLGACLGALSTPVNPEAGVALAWLTPLSLFSGFFAVAACSYLAAAYLTLETRRGHEAELYPLWRRRALATGLWTGALAASGLVLLYLEAPLLWERLAGPGRAGVLASLVAGAASVLALARHRPGLAALATGTAIAGVLGAWLYALAPSLPPSGLTLAEAKAPDSVLRAMLWICAVGLALVLPSLALLLHLFKVQPRDPGPQET